MALLPLLRPFEWQGPFIPLVPKNLEECVESPVPCVLGMPTTTEDDLIPVVMDDCLIVNIETEQVVLPERSMAPLPNEEELYGIRSFFRLPSHINWGVPQIRATGRPPWQDLSTGQHPRAR